MASPASSLDYSLIEAAVSHNGRSPSPNNFYIEGPASWKRDQFVEPIEDFSTVNRSIIKTLEDTINDLFIQNSVMDNKNAAIKTLTTENEHLRRDKEAIETQYKELIESKGNDDVIAQQQINNVLRKELAEVTAKTEKLEKEVKEQIKLRDMAMESLKTAEDEKKILEDSKTQLNTRLTEAKKQLQEISETEKDSKQYKLENEIKMNKLEQLLVDERNRTQSLDCKLKEMQEKYQAYLTTASSPTPSPTRVSNTPEDPETLKKCISELQTKMKQLDFFRKSEIYELQQTKEQLKQELANAKVDKDLQDKCVGLEQNILQLRAEIVVLQKKLDDQEVVIDENTNLKTQLSQYQQKYVKLGEEKEELAKIHDELKHQSGGLQREANEKENLEKTVVDLLRKCEDLEKQKEDLLKPLKEAQDFSTVLKTELTETTDQLTKIKEEKTETEDRLLKLNQELELEKQDLQQQLLNSQASQVDSARYTRQMNELRQQIKQLENEKEYLKKSIEELEKINDTLTA